MISQNSKHVFGTEEALYNGLVPRGYPSQPFSEVINHAAVARSFNWSYGGTYFPRCGVAGTLWNGENSSGNDFFLALHGTIIMTTSNPTSVTLTVTAGSSDGADLLIRHGFTAPNAAVIYTAGGGSTAVGNEYYLGVGANGVYQNCYMWFVPWGSSFTTVGAGTVRQFHGLYIFGKFRNALQSPDRYVITPWSGSYKYANISWAGSGYSRFGAVYAVPYADAEKNSLIAQNSFGNLNAPVLYSEIVGFYDLRNKGNGTFGGVQSVGLEYLPPFSQSFRNNLITVVSS
jgi:hypothetical protein